MNIASNMQNLHLANALINIRLLRQRADLLGRQLEQPNILLFRCNLRLGNVQVLVRGDDLGFDFLQQLVGHTSQRNRTSKICFRSLLLPFAKLRWGSTS